MDKLVNDALEIHELPEKSFLVSKHDAFLTSSDKLNASNKASMRFGHGKQEHSLPPIVEHLRRRLAF
jgi:hypothetical protein